MSTKNPKNKGSVGRIKNARKAKKTQKTTSKSEVKFNLESVQLLVRQRKLRGLAIGLIFVLYFGMLGIAALKLNTGENAISYKLNQNLQNTQLINSSADFAIGFIGFTAEQTIHAIADSGKLLMQAPSWALKKTRKNIKEIAEYNADDAEPYADHADKKVEHESNEAIELSHQSTGVENEQEDKQVSSEPQGKKISIILPFTSTVEYLAHEIPDAIIESYVQVYKNRPDVITQTKTNIITGDINSPSSEMESTLTLEDLNNKIAYQLNKINMVYVSAKAESKTASATFSSKKVLGKSVNNQKTNFKAPGTKMVSNMIGVANQFADDLIMDVASGAELIVQIATHLQRAPGSESGYEKEIKRYAEPLYSPSQ